jgi:CheY-like chemotaxis protein
VPTSLAGIKILMLTAKGRDTDVAKGMGLGADAYMTKPFSTKDLAAKRACAGSAASMRAHGPKIDRRECWRRWPPGAAVLAVAALGGGAWRATLVRRRAHGRLGGVLEPPGAAGGPALVAAMVLGATGAQQAWRRWVAAPRAWPSRHRCWWPPTCSARSGPDAGRAECRRWQVHQPAGAPARRARPTSLPNVCAGQPRRRAGAQPPGRADGRADPERGGVQPGRPHPALQQPCAHAVPCPATRQRWPAGAELVGLGRSIYAVFDRQLVAHALESVQQRLRAVLRTRRRSLSPAHAAGSCCARRWRRCALAGDGR